MSILGFAPRSAVFVAWLLALWLCLTGPVIAQDALLDKARAELQAGRPEAAFALLAPQEAQRAGDPAFDYLLGIAALDAGQPTRAIFALERVLALQPRNNLARAEIARAYLASGETDTAVGELQSALREPMPPEAAAAIDRVLGALGRGGRSADSNRSSGYIELAVGHDSNINSATASEQFALPGIGLFTLSADSRVADAWFSSFALGGSHVRALSEGRNLVLSGSGQTTFHAGSDRFEPTQLDLSAALTQRSHRDTWTVGAQFGQLWLDGQRQRIAAGISGLWQRQLDESWELAGFAQGARLVYPGQSVRNGTRFIAGAGVARSDALGGSVRYATAYVGQEVPSSGVAALEQSIVGARAGLEWQAMGLTWWGQGQLESRRHQGAEPLFNERRNDRQIDLRLGLRWNLPGDWQLQPQLSWTDNHSNIVIYDYRRTVLKVTLRRDL